MGTVVLVVNIDGDGGYSSPYQSMVLVVLFMVPNFTGGVTAKICKCTAKARPKIDVDFKCLRLTGNQKY